MDFDARRRRKWARGRAERGLSPDAPFDGNPCVEGQDECVDLANYVEQAIRDGRVPERVGDEIIRQAYGIDMILGVYAKDVA